MKFESILVVLILQLQLRCESQRLTQLKAYMNSQFSFDETIDPFLKGLNDLPDEITSQEVDLVLGPNYSIVKSQFKVAETFAVNLVVGDMKLYRESIVNPPPNISFVFSDFYDVMAKRLRPETIMENKEVYTVIFEIDESELVKVYSSLLTLYSNYEELTLYIDNFKSKFMGLIIAKVNEKCPEYQPPSLPEIPNTQELVIEKEPEEEIEHPQEKDLIEEIKKRALLSMKGQTVVSSIHNFAVLSVLFFLALIVGL